jgi:cytochrome bd-type quinol oxidase subunit 2
MELRYVVAVVSALLILGGIYAMFFYDVPDVQEVTNMWVSWFLIVVGVVGIALSLLWKKKRNPLLSEE